MPSLCGGGTVSDAESCVPCGAAAGTGSSSGGTSSPRRGDGCGSSTLPGALGIMGLLHLMPQQARQLLQSAMLARGLTVAFNGWRMLPFSLVYREGFYLPFGKAHVFPGVKYRLIRERLLETRAAVERDFLPAQPIAVEDVLRVHESGYVERLIHGTLSEQEI